jgi:hypothetical protein
MIKSLRWWSVKSRSISGLSAAAEVVDRIGRGLPDGDHAGRPDSGFSGTSTTTMTKMLAGRQFPGGQVLENDFCLV